MPWSARTGRDHPQRPPVPAAGGGAQSAAPASAAGWSRRSVCGPRTPASAASAGRSRRLLVADGPEPMLLGLLDPDAELTEAIQPADGSRAPWRSACSAGSTASSRTPSPVWPRRPGGPFRLAEWQRDTVRTGARRRPGLAGRHGGRGAGRSAGRPAHRPDRPGGAVGGGPGPARARPWPLSADLVARRDQLGSPMATVLLVRHGRTAANTAGILAGRSPGVELDDVGREQAADPRCADGRGAAGRPGQLAAAALPADRSRPSSRRAPRPCRRSRRAGPDRVRLRRVDRASSLRELEQGEALEHRAAAAVGGPVPGRRGDDGDGGPRRRRDPHLGRADRRRARRRTRSGWRSRTAT